jgi:hypothetical protein
MASRRIGSRGKVFIAFGIVLIIAGGLIGLAGYISDILTPRIYSTIA